MIRNEGSRDADVHNHRHLREVIRSAYNGSKESEEVSTMVLGKRWQLWKVFAGAVFLMTFSGCTATVVHSPDHVRGVLAKSEHKKLEAENYSITEKFSEEAKLYPSNSGNTSATKPKACVSFSGGGIRSAAFGIGVMKGLHELSLNEESRKGYFDQVDVISGVSGGSYAVTWYHMNQIKGRYNRHTIFNTPPKDIDSAECKLNALCYLQRHADFVDTPTTTFSLIGDIAGIPFNLLANGIFGWHWNTSGVANFLYERAITSTFHGGDTADLNDLRTFLEGQKKKEDPLPIPIVTTTWRIDEDQYHQQAKLSNSVLEVTPLWYGSEGLGYSPPYRILDNKEEATNKKEGVFPFKSIAELVEISGSALDTPQGLTGSSQRVVLSALNIDTGRFFSNDYEGRSGGVDQGSLGDTILKSVLPLGLYFAPSAYFRDAYGDQIYLSDGGYSDNLAAWPLVRRLCENIIIVDAEEDPVYTFDSYFRFKHAVEREMHVLMQLQPEEEACGKEDKWDLDIDRIEATLEERRTVQNRKKENWKEESSKSHYCPKVSVIDGSIGPFLIKNQPPNDDITLHVTYIKMALDESLADEDLKTQYGEAAKDYFRATQSQTCETRPIISQVLRHIGLWSDCKFPHYATLHQNYAPKQFAAYVSLGENIVKNQIVNCGNGRLVPERWHGCTPPPLLPKPATTK